MIAAEAPPSSRSDAFRVMVAQLLGQADTALAAGRLTTPAADNAFDKYNAVLLIEPANVYATAGLQAVQLRYFELAEDALDRGQLDSAARYLAAVDKVFGSHRTLSRLRGTLRKKRAVLAVPVKLEEQDVATAKRITLDQRALKQRSDALKVLLARASARVQQTDESIMIFAPNDAQGRWIYQTMKSFAPGYLIRGDIRLHQRPALEFLEPLN